MRTNTVTFRANAFKALRAQGLTSAKAKTVVTLLATDMRLRGCPVLPDGTEIRVSMDSERSQSIDYVLGGAAIAQLRDYDLRKLNGFDAPALQPLVNCIPTPRQVEIGKILSDMVSDVYDAIGQACQAFDAEFGHPADDAACLDRDAFTKAFPAVAEVNAAYDALKAESLAINPNVAAELVDPDKAGHWYEWHHDLYRYRPTGFVTLANVEAQMERMKDIPIDFYDDEPAAHDEPAELETVA